MNSEFEVRRSAAVSFITPSGLTDLIDSRVKVKPNQTIIYVVNALRAV